MYENLDKERERLKNQYLYEKSLYERLGTRSVRNGEE